MCRERTSALRPLRSRLIVQASLMIVMLFGASLAWAGTFNAFGPQSYVRDTGQPVTVSNTFSILNPNTQYTLHVQNSGVSSAVISVNGNQILGPSNFAPNVTSIDRSVTLNLSNEIDVQLRSKPGSSLTVSVIGIDNDPPVITAAANPPADGFGWNNTNVVVSFTCSDATSGVASCPAPVTVSTEGANQVISGTATDQAGNTASTSVTINLDKTPPTIAASPAPPANTFGWNNTSVTVTFNCADALSGVATCTAPITLSTEGANQIATGTATDKAGNNASATATINIDKTPPTISVQSTPAPNAAGWNNTNVTVSFSCADALSGIATCPGPQTVSAEGANQSVAGIAADKAGNTATAAVSLNIDKTPPVVTANISPQPNAAGWNNTDVTVSFQCSDALSGVATCPPSQTVTSEGANQAISGTATDVAGNSANATATINLDKTPPVISISSPANNSFSSTSTLQITGTATDALSEVASTTCNGSAAIFQGNSFTCSVTLSPGANTITIIATDVAGNSSSQAITVNLGPAITDFNPKSASVGGLITVSGSGFTSGPGAPQVVLGSQNGGTIAAPLANFASTTLSFVIPDGAASGIVTITVGTQTVTSTATLTIVPSSDFALAVGPNSANLIQGQAVNFAVTLSSTSGFNQLAALSVSGVPSGVTAQFRPPQITAGQTSLLTLSAPAGQAVGPATLKISASATVNGIGLTQSASVALNVQPVSTSFIGRTSVDDARETPLAGVTVTFLGKDGMGGTTQCSGQTQSDQAGNFSFTGLGPECSGPQLIGYDGTTVTSPPGTYAGVNLVYALQSGQVTTSPVVVHLPRIDNKETFFVQQNSAQDQSHSYKSVPGLSVTIYAGTTFTMPDGSKPDPFPLVALEVPVDRLPDQKPTVPTMLSAFIVAFQPANVVASRPAAVSYPNTLNTPPGSNMTLMTLDPTLGRMVPYGTGTVSLDGTQIVPDGDPAFPGARFGIVHFDWHGPMPQPPPQTNPAPPGTRCPIPHPAQSKGAGNGGCGQKATGGKPVDLFSGIETINETDMSIAGLRGSISIERTYRSLSSNAGPFGIGTNHNYGYQLAVFGFLQGQGVINLIMPDGNQFPFNRQPNGTLINTMIPAFAGAVLSNPSGGVYNLRWKDGTIYQFQPSPQGPRVAFLTSITDRNGNATPITLNPNIPGQVVQVTDPVGRSLNLAYDGAGRVATITDPIGRAVQYTYNSQGTLASVTDPAGGVTQYGYDTQNRLITVTDPRGTVQAQNTLDSNGRVIRQVRPDGGTLTFDYFPLNPDAPTSPIMFTRVTDDLGVSEGYRFNPQGFVTDVVATGGQMVSAARASGTNQVLSTTEANSTETLAYDANGNVLKSTDPLGNATTFTYEPLFNNVTLESDPLGNTTSSTYDPHGNLLTQTDANGHTTSFVYNSFGQVTQRTDPLGQKTTFAYDAFGNLISITDPLGNTTSMVYDAVSRLVQTTDALGRRSQIVYDALNRVTKQINAQGNPTQFVYDANSNLISLTDANRNTTSFAYDSMNRLLTRTDPLGKADERSYDSDGNLTQFVDRRGLISKFRYDNLNRLIQADYQDSTVVRLYDVLGRLVHVNDSAGGEFDFAYDPAGNLLGSVNPIGSVQYTYDADDRTTSRQVAGQPALTYSYDPVGNLLSAVLPQVSATFVYDARDQLLKISRANGITSQYQYDPAGRLLSLAHSGPSRALNSQSYAYDAVGNRTSYTTNTGQPLITQAVNANTFDAGNRLLQSDGSISSYDPNGNLTTITKAAGTSSFTWDGRNRLTSISGPSTQASFKYDFAGNLISQSVNGRSRTYLVDDLTNISVLNDNGDHVEILSERSIDQHLALIHSDGQIEYSLPDARDSTVMTTDQNGRPIGSFSYEPFGQTSSTETAFPFQFTGRVPDTSGTYYYRARFYDPIAARFLSEDPFGFGATDADTNLYAYTQNNPIRLIDPSGMEPFDEGDDPGLTDQELRGLRKKLQDPNVSQKEKSRIRRRIDHLGRGRSKKKHGADKINFCLLPPSLAPNPYYIIPPLIFLTCAFCPECCPFVVWGTL